MAPRTLTSLRAGRPLRFGELTLVPVERVRVRVTTAGTRVHADAGKEVAAIVILSAGGARAFAPSGDPVELAPLIAEASGLRELLPA